MIEQILPSIVLNPPMDISVISNLDQLPELVEFLRANPEFGWDIETTPLKDFYYRRCRTMQFGTRTKQYLIDLLDIVGGDTAALRDSQGAYGKHLDPRLKKVIEAIGPFLQRRCYVKVGVNLGFEYLTHYWCFGLRTQGFWDCMMVEKAIWAGAHSLKDYGFFGMANMVGRYFKKNVEKELQSSFNLTEPLTDEQIEYACLDTRLPLLLKKAQEYIINGNSRNAIPKWVNAPAFLCGDDLTEICKIENDAIGSFQDMSVHGDCLDIPRWTKKIEKRKVDLVAALKDLDAAFIPHVGKKGGVAYTEAQIETANQAWKAIKLPKPSSYTEGVDDETGKPFKFPEYTPEDALIVDAREKLKIAYSNMKKSNTALKKLTAGCQGEALINYNSPKQLKDVLLQIPELKGMKSTDAETLEKLEHVPICHALSTYRKIAKEISTYGMTWCMEWVNEVPSNENNEVGWINPNDHRLHPQYNQYDAETGRSSSSGPNGQNLPHDPETRACFVAGPPDEEISGLMNSKCCGARAMPVDNAYNCTECGHLCEVEPESYVLLTIDMSGAELRILAESANEKIWIDAFNKGQDVHCICCELVDPTKWKSLQCTPGEKIIKKGKEKILPPCAYFLLGPDGKPQKVKCDCPEHNEYRNDFKPVNFGIAYGLGPRALSVQIKKPEDFCKEVLKKHKTALPVLWMYIDMSGKRAVDQMKAFDMFGRRRLFREPTYEDAVRFAHENLDEEGKPMSIKSALKALYGYIERQGKNHPIQSGNATIAKLALGSGSDKNGKPFLWHIFPKYHARIIKFVHDEFVVRCYKSNAKKVALLTADAIRRAAAERMSKVVMESESNIDYVWVKG